METNEIFRGRLIDHIQIIVKDLTVSQKFYEGILNALEISISGTGPGFFWADELVISSADSPAALGKLTGRNHLAFQARDEEMVKAFYQAGLKAGGKDNGAPGEREYHPGYFAAFLIDPDGDNIEAVYHGKANRSSEAIKITF